MRIAKQYHNSTIEEGKIYHFEECGHLVSMWIYDQEPPWKIYCPICGERHNLITAGYDSESTSMNRLAAKS